MYGILLAAAGWQHFVQKVGADIGLLSSSNCPFIWSFMVTTASSRRPRLTVTETERKSLVLWKALLCLG